MDDDELLSYTRAAKLVGVDRKLLREWIDEGRLPVCRMPGRKNPRIRRGALRQLIESFERIESTK